MLKKIDWVPFVFLLTTPPLAIGLTALHLFKEGFIWQIWILTFVLYIFTGLGITAGYHRLFAHRSFEAKPWARWMLAIAGTMTFQNSIFVWCRDHRLHHRFVDKNEDPYSISNGFWFAHIGWMLMKPIGKPDPTPYGRDFEQDWLIQFQHKYYGLLAVVFGFGIPTLIGWGLGSAFGGFAVAGLLRMVVIHHVTFFINSFCHKIGAQEYTDENSARDSLVMALLTFGEGYHNFHHVFTRDYRNGVRWYHWDPTKWFIQFLKICGGVGKLYRTPEQDILAARLKMQEFRLKTRFSFNWTVQAQAKVDALRLSVQNAQNRLENLKSEYRSLSQQYSLASAEKVRELKMRIALAKVEFRSARKQWKIYYCNVMRAGPQLLSLPG